MAELIIRNKEWAPTLDLKSLSAKARVNDLLQAFQQATDDKLIYKPQLKTRYGVCAGCRDNCCRQFEINPDFLSATKIAKSKGMGLKEYSLKFLDFNEDLYFPKFIGKPCPYLKSNLCTIYPIRPLICRLYLCTPMSDSLENLRAAVCYMGEGALIVELLKEGLLPPSFTYEYRIQTIESDWQAGNITKRVYDLRMEQHYLMYHQNPYLKGSDYDSVLLKDCCPEGFWQTLPFK